MRGGGGGSLNLNIDKQKEKIKIWWTCMVTEFLHTDILICLVSNKIARQTIAVAMETGCRPLDNSSKRLKNNHFGYFKTNFKLLPQFESYRTK